MNAGNDADTFIGGTGADIFEFAQDAGEPVYDSGVGRGNRDRVVDFKGSEGDKISFRFIADDLTFVGEEFDPGVNEVGFIETGGATILRANTADERRRRRLRDRARRREPRPRRGRLRVLSGSGGGRRSAAAQPFWKSPVSARPMTLETLGAGQGGEGERAADVHGGDADAGGQRAVDDALAEAAGDAGEHVAAGDRADQVVADRDGAGGEQVGRDHAQQPPGAEEAGVGAVDVGDAADHADVLRERGEHVDEGERDQRGGGGDGAARGLDLAAGLRRRAGRGGRARSGARMASASRSVVALLGEALRGSSAARGGRRRSGRGGAERARAASRSAVAWAAAASARKRVDAGEAAEGPELADELDEHDEREERGQGEGDEAEGREALRGAPVR